MLRLEMLGGVLASIHPAGVILHIILITNALCFINPSPDITGVEELSYHSQLSRKIRIT